MWIKGTLSLTWNLISEAGCNLDAPGWWPSAAKPQRVLATNGALNDPSARTVAVPNTFIAACLQDVRLSEYCGFRVCTEVLSIGFTETAGPCEAAESPEQASAQHRQQHHTLTHLLPSCNLAWLPVCVGRE